MTEQRKTDRHRVQLASLFEARGRHLSTSSTRDVDFGIGDAEPSPALLIAGWRRIGTNPTGSR